MGATVLQQVFWCSSRLGILYLYMLSDRYWSRCKVAIEAHSTRRRRAALDLNHYRRLQ